MKKCSIFLIIIKTSIGYHLTSARTADIKETKIISIGKDVKKREPLCQWVGMVFAAAIIDNIWQFLKKEITIELPYEPAILLLSIYPKK